MSSLQNNDVKELDLKIKQKSKKLKNPVGVCRSSKKRVKNDVTGVSNAVVKKRRKVKKETPTNNTDNGVEEKKDTILTDNIDWPEKDLSELFTRIETLLPEKDTLAFNTRVEKLDWNEVAFNPYTGEDCKKTWFLVQKRLRKFRILRELLSDAKEWIGKPWTNFYKGCKTKKHPEMPRRPLSIYMLFYLKEKNNILAANPGLETTEVSKKITELYKTMSPEERQKFADLAAEGRREYEEKLAEFHRKYPDFSRPVEKPSQKHKEVGPKKPRTPYMLYCSEQIRLLTNSGLEKKAMQEQIKNQWRDMSEKKKVVWIDWALEEEAKYQDQVKNYLLQNPNYVPSAVKPVLTKEEKTIKQRVAGKPIKPPSSAYSLFSQILLQSEAIKSVDPKNRLNTVADHWKLCSDEEKRHYKEKAIHMMEQYKLEFASYLESLPEDQRQEELQNNIPKPKRKSKVPVDNKVPKKKPRPIKQEPVEPVETKEPPVTESIPIPQNTTSDTNISLLLENEPKQPPVSAYAYFSMSYSGSGTPKDAWKSLPTAEKKKCETKVTQLKQIYIKHYEKFLKSLTKKQLTAYSNFKKSQKTVKIEAESQDEDESDESDCSSQE